MRKIKFRGQANEVDKEHHVKVGEFVYGELLTGNYPIFPPSVKPPLILNGGGAWDVIPETVSQYTGLKDKNGKEIYEGDILKHQGEVIWNDEEHQWSAIDLNWNDRREIHNLDYLTSPFEIIGNIYENPELIKQ